MCPLSYNILNLMLSFHFLMCHNKPHSKPFPCWLVSYVDIHQYQLEVLVTDYHLTLLPPLLLTFDILNVK